MPGAGQAPSGWRSPVRPRPACPFQSREPAAELTASMHHTTSGYFLSTSAISSTGFWMPVDVSLCVMQMVSYLPVEEGGVHHFRGSGLPQFALENIGGHAVARSRSCTICRRRHPQKKWRRVWRCRNARSLPSGPYRRKWKAEFPVPSAGCGADCWKCGAAGRRPLWIGVPSLGPLMAASTSGATSVGPGRIIWLPFVFKNWVRIL